MMRVKGGEIVMDLQSKHKAAAVSKETPKEEEEADGEKGINYQQLYRPEFPKQNSKLLG